MTNRKKERKTGRHQIKNRSIDRFNDRYVSTQTQIRKKTLKMKNLPESESNGIELLLLLFTFNTEFVVADDDPPAAELELVD